MHTLKYECISRRFFTFRPGCICAKQDYLYIVQCSNLFPAPHNSFGEKSLFGGEDWGFFLPPVLSPSHLQTAWCCYFFGACGWYAVDFTFRESPCNGQALHNWVQQAALSSLTTCSDMTLWQGMSMPITHDTWNRSLLGYFAVLLLNWLMSSVWTVWF